MPPSNAIDMSVMAYAISRISQKLTGKEVLFGPGQPLQVVNADPAPRQFQYPVSINMATQPRRDMPNLTPFETLRYLAKKHPLAALCVRVRAEQMSALQWRVIAKDKRAQAAEQGTCDALNAWWAQPDRHTERSAWLKMFTRDILEIDAPTLYKRPSRGGGLYGLDVIDGATIKPILDDRGRTVAYQQILYGLPLSQYRGARVGIDEYEVVGEFSLGELWYQPYSPQTTSPYGRPGMEDLIDLAWTGIKKIDFDLGHFTDGNIPGALAVLTGDGNFMPNIGQIGDFEENFNATLMGDTQRGHKIKFIPFPMKIERLTELSTGGQYESAFEERMVKLFCATYGLTPAEIGFTEDVNRSTGDSQENVQYRIGIKPFAQWLKTMVFDPIIQRDLGQPQCEMVPDYGESEDQLKEAQIHQIDIAGGVLRAQESRMMRYPDLDGKAPGPPAAPGQPAPLAMLMKRAEDEAADDAEQRLVMEEQAVTLLGAFFASQLVRLQAEVAKNQALDSFWRDEQPATLRAVLPLWDTVLTEASAAGVAQMRIGVEWGQVNQAVLKLARAEAARLATQLTDTSKAQAAQIIADWIQDGGTLEELTARLARIYPETRARLIAATEVTRLYAVGNKAAWDASEVVTGYTWKTARDERVCPICGALHNQRFDKSDTTVPPAHPGCRCWIVPEVE